MKKKITPFHFTFIIFIIGAFLTISANNRLTNGVSLPVRILLSAAAAAVINLIFALIVRKFTGFVRKTDLTNIILLCMSLTFGLICGKLIGWPVSRIPGMIGTYGPLILTLLSCLAAILAIQTKNEAFIAFVNRITNGRFQVSELVSRKEKVVLIDTSVIIDGRIADIARTGFVPGTLIIPSFVLQELQYIADSEDSQRRQRGRRGLEILAELQKDLGDEIRITDFNIPDVKEVDAKLVVLAQQLDCPVLTNDYNLNKVADLQGVRILNVNDLANAVKSILLPGEHLFISVIQEGKEQFQGVGYLEDGTMVVVENGRAYLGHDIDVVVTKILQTTAGRMIFARHEKELGVKR